MKRSLGTLVGTGVLLAATAASAQGYSGGYSTGTYRPAVPSYPSGVDNIGNAGQFTIAIERITGLFFDRTGHENASTDKVTHFAFLGNFGASLSTTPRAGFDYFVIDGLSLGGSVSYMSDAPSGGPTQKLFLISPRVGYAYAFDDTFSIWPRAAFTYAHESTSVSGHDASGAQVYGTASTNLTQLDIEAMLGISPMKHVAFLLGPYLDLGLGGSSSSDLPQSTKQGTKLTSSGLSAALLAYY